MEPKAFAAGQANTAVQRQRSSVVMLDELSHQASRIEGIAEQLYTLCSRLGVSIPPSPEAPTTGKLAEVDNSNFMDAYHLTINRLTSHVQSCQRYLEAISEHF